jgi:RNA polymerase sigma-70 factor (ECF subfamily)
MSTDRNKRQQPDDEYLLTRVGERDQQAFEALYDRYETRAFSLAYRILGSRTLAEEATQEAFLSIWKNAGSYDPSRGSAGGWSLGVVRNRSIDLLRSQSGLAPDLDHDDEAALDNSVGPADTENLAIERDTRQRLRSVVAELPEKQSKVINLAYFGGFSQSEISEMLDIPLGTVKGRMRLGLERLRGGLEESGARA